MNGVLARRAVQVVQGSSRQLATSRNCLSKDVEIVKVNYEKLKQKQAHFQQDSEVPLYLKGGMLDRLLYQLTIGVGIVGFAVGAKFFYESAYPKK